MLNDEYIGTMRRVYTIEALGKMEEAIRLSERIRVAAFVRSCREDRDVVQVFDILADQIENGKHWE